MHINKQNRKLDILKLHTLNYIYIYIQLKRMKKKNKQNRKERKKNSKILEKKLS